MIKILKIYWIKIYNDYFMHIMLSWHAFTVLSHFLICSVSGSLKNTVNFDRMYDTFWKNIYMYYKKNV